MTCPATVPDTVLRDGRVVMPGDAVALVPRQIQGDSDDLFFEQERFEFLVRWLGQGPFTIASIAVWPCGKTVLCLDQAKTDQPEVDASDFI